jgi:hypothetical protein
MKKLWENRVWKPIDRWLDRVAKVDWPRLWHPSGKIVKNNPEYAFGIETTWRYTGPGIAIGVGKVDLWFGWPPRENAGR